jgi:acetyltransferase-like isoleucine patch superfamily enzyme
MSRSPPRRFSGQKTWLTNAIRIARAYKPSTRGLTLTRGFRRLGGVRGLLSKLLAVGRRVRLTVWAARARTRMKWVGIRLEFEAGEGVVFVRQPFVLAGGEEPAGRQGSLRVKLGRRVRFAPGVIIEAEPGHDSTLEIGAGTRIGTNVHFHLRGGAVRIGPACEIRDGCVLKATGGEIELGEKCFMSYGCVLHATERIVLEERVGVGERVTMLDSSHDTDGGDEHWKAQALATEPVVIGANTLVFANAVITMGTHVGPNSQVAAGALVRGEHPAGALLAGVPARVVKSLSDD